MSLTRRGFFGSLSAMVAGAISASRINWQPDVVKVGPEMVTETWTVNSAFCGFSREDRAYAEQFKGRRLRVSFPVVSA